MYRLTMKKILISIPDPLAARLRIVIPARQRSKVITQLLTVEIDKREHDLYACALAVEQDKNMRKEMQDWDVTVKDGIDDDETW
jgi:hypothetical protein